MATEEAICEFELPPDSSIEEAAPALRAERLSEGVLYLVILTGVQRLIGFVRAMFFCGLLDPEQLGLWEMAWSFLIMAAPLAVLSVPGTFGRYAEYFRLRGQLRIFIRRTAAFCLVSALAAVGLIALWRPWFSEFIFDTSEQTRLVLMLSGSLLSVIAYNYFISLFVALRNVRLMLRVDLLNSVVFAVAGVTLMWFWKQQAAMAVFAYGVSCLVCVTVSMGWLHKVWRSAPPAQIPPQRGELWAKLAPFAAWMLAINFLTHIFLLADRWLLLHLAPGGALEGQYLVGQYHSARIVPQLLATITGFLATMVLPHLTHDWELGRRDRVSSRLTLVLKLSTLATTAVGVGMLVLAPPLFRWGFGSKFAAGLEIMPWTLLYCVWAGAAAIGQQYLWCAEKASRGCVAMLLGFLMNVALSLLLIPIFGLKGAVVAATAANLTALVVALGFSAWHGYRGDWGLVIVLAAPVSLLGGGWCSLAVLGGVCVLALVSRAVLSLDDKQRLMARVCEYREMARGLIGSLRRVRGTITDGSIREESVEHEGR